MARGKRAEIIKLTMDGVEVDAKMCTKCGEVKALSEFSNDARGAGGARSACKRCEHSATITWRKENAQRRRAVEARHRQANRTAHNEKQRIYAANNKEKQKQATKNWCLANKEKVNATRRSWHERNKVKANSYKAKRRAINLHLPASALEKMEPTCALSGSNANTHLDHFIPLSSGHAGSYVENYSIISQELNNSKSDANPFEWFEANRQRFDLDQSRFDALVWRLAKQNGLTPEEFRKFTYWCFENPRTVEQIAADNARYGYKKPSLEIWREQAGLPFPIAVDFGDTTLNNVGRSIA